MTIAHLGLLLVLIVPIAQHVIWSMVIQLQIQLFMVMEIIMAFSRRLGMIIIVYIIMLRILLDAHQVRILTVPKIATKLIRNRVH